MTPDPQSIRTFRASSLPEALAQVKRELGPDALILGTRQIERRGIAALVGPVVEITAAKAAAEGTEARRHGGTKSRDQGTANREPDAPGHGPLPVASDLRVRRAAERGGQPPSAGNAERVGLRSKDTTGTVLPESTIAHRRTAAGGCPPWISIFELRSSLFGRARRAFDIPHSTFDIPIASDPLRRWYERLVQRELGEHLARLVIDHVRRRLGRTATPSEIDAAIRAELARLMPAAGGIALRPDGPTRIALVGPPGSGKTTTLAKIAAHFRLRENKRVAIVSLDAHRLGTAEQLERYGRIIGATVLTIRTPEEAQVIFGVDGPAESDGARQGREGRGNKEQVAPADGPLPVASDLRVRRGPRVEAGVGHRGPTLQGQCGTDTRHSLSACQPGAAGPHVNLRSSHFDLLLIDTPGVSPNDVELRRELDGLLRAAEPHEVHLVLPASLRPDVQRRTIEAFALFGVRRVVLSRLDEASGFGVVLEMLRQLDWAVSYLTTGQKVPTDLKKACGADLAALLLSAEAAGA